MWTLADQDITSRLFIGTALYPSPQIMVDAIRASAAEVVTVSLRRQAREAGAHNVFWENIRELGLQILPNTAGCHSVKEAVTTAHMARELFGTRWIKLEVIGDEYTLQPDPFGLLEATEELIAQDFEVFPYCTDDLVLCEKLIAAGCRILMPWGSPIGTGRGLINPYALKQLRQRFAGVTLVVDAGIGAPSHAAQAMELGYDAVLLNTAVARSPDPVRMAQGFAAAVEAGRCAFEAGIMPEKDLAQPSTPTLGTPFWQQNA
ncbi:MAG: thiazole synthase [Pseudomonadota bacterium]